jgi:intracellular multiplication protein IcmV
MAVRDVLKVNRKTFFNPRAWLGYDALKAQTVFLYNLIKNIFVTTEAAPVRTESFAEALTRLNLTEQEADDIGKNYLFYSLGFVGIAAFAMLFGFYLLFVHHTFAGWILSLSITALLLAQAFRYHFWHFQIKFRKLGCTFEEWKQGKPFDQEPKA